MTITLAIFPGNFLPHLGGLETHVDGFVSHLEQHYDKDYNLIICTPSVQGAPQQETIHGNVRVYRYPAFEIIKDFPVPKIWHPRFWQTMHTVNRLRPDIVMTRTMFFTNTFIGTVFAKLRFRPKKLLHVEHASNFTPHNRFVSLINICYMRTLGALTLRLADRVVAVSDGVKEFLARSFPRTRKKTINVIRRGYDYQKTARVAPDTAIRKQFSKAKLIGYVGRLIDGKGIQDAIHALSHLHDEYHLLIIGEGEYKRTLQDIAMNLDLQQRVHFIGRLPHDKAVAMLKSCDAVVNPSYAEGLPTAVLDGYFAGRPIVATAVGGTKEILGELWNTKSGAYRLVPLAQPKLLAAALHEVTGKEPTISAQIKRRFDWNEHARQYHVLIQEMMGKAAMSVGEAK